MCIGLITCSVRYRFVRPERTCVRAIHGRVVCACGANLYTLNTVLATLALHRSGHGRRDRRELVGSTSHIGATSCGSSEARSTDLHNPTAPRQRPRHSPSTRKLLTRCVRGVDTRQPSTLPLRSRYPRPRSRIGDCTVMSQGFHDITIKPSTTAPSPTTSLDRESEI